jgi:hypothetical protein
MRPTFRLALALGALLWIQDAGRAEDAPPAAEKPTAEGLRFFESKIRPLLAERCYKCHGPAKQESGLRLDTRAGILEGGNAGPAVVPGKPTDSLLLTAVSYDDADLKMPPDRKLAAGQIADLKRWVAMGAPHPDASDRRAVGGTSGRAGGVSPLISRDAKDAKVLQAARGFWAFQPPRDPPPPAVRDASWPSGPLDRFVLAALEARGLKPAPRADKRTLIRRVTFDLIGLPPTPEETGAFLRDASPRAFANVVERLLASPRYGERWGRHWLDVARYADSNGLDENICHGNAWRYRDYVVAALNADKSFDQFVLEQLAGDLLPTDDPAVRHERLIATGFLSLGPKVLAEPDKTKMEMDIIDEQVDTVGRAFMGLTLGCARCHDHKFDPVPTEDYYALAGIFKSTRTMETFTTIARWNENPIATPAELARKAKHDQLLAAKQAEIDRLAKEETANSKAPAIPTAANAVAVPKSAEERVSAVKARLDALKNELEQLKKTPPDITTAMGVTEGAATDLRVHVRGSHLTLGETVPRGFPHVLLRGNAPAMDGKHSGRLQLAQWLVRRDHPLTARVMANRIWRWHFGQGLVRSPDNFGLLGERPTNQPLLDWLAHRFVASGWSIKAMHRLIVLSSTYQMSSASDPAAAAVDPDNLLQWRADIRRLEAETLRDALLAVSGSLDPQMGGSLVHVKNREFFFDHTSKDTTRYDSHRRSVYLPVVRNHLYDVFQLFDFGDGTVLSGHRTASTIAPQALFMMNSDLVLSASEQLAGRLLASAGLSDAARIADLYSRAVGRPPTREEVERAMAFLGRAAEALSARQAGLSPSRREAWRLLCQSVLASNEFLHFR